jgi:LysM repeat protein
MHAPEEEFEDYGPEPNMKLSHAFLAVLLLHVVAVGGLYAFNSMKAGKSSTAKTARSTEPVASQKQPSNDQDSDNTGGSGSGSGSGPSGEPPAPSKAPLVAKVSEAPKAVKAATESVARQTKQTSTATTAPRGILASAKSMIGKTLGASGIGAAAVSTSSAQEPATSTSPASQAPQPSRVTALSGIPATANTYMVKAGDTLTRIASSLGVAIPELEKVNGMTEKSVLQVGQILKVPTKVMSQAVSDVSAQAGKVEDSVQQAPAAVVGAVT